MPAEPASSAHPSALETFYDSWVKRSEPSLAARAERGARLAPITPCAHDALLHFDEQGHGPFCTHCGGIVYHHAVRHHAAPVTLRGALWDKVCTAVLWIQAWFQAPVTRELEQALANFGWLAVLTCYVGLAVFAALRMAIQPITWVDYVLFYVNFTLITAAGTTLLMWWARLLPRRLLTWS